MDVFESHCGAHKARVLENNAGESLKILHAASGSKIWHVCRGIFPEKRGNFPVQVPSGEYWRVIALTPKV